MLETFLNIGFWGFFVFQCLFFVSTVFIANKLKLNKTITYVFLFAKTLYCVAVIRKRSKSGIEHIRKKLAPIFQILNCRAGKQRIDLFDSFDPVFLNLHGFGMIDQYSEFRSFGIPVDAQAAVNYRVVEGADPLVFVPLVDFEDLEDPSIIDAF